MKHFLFLTLFILLLSSVSPHPIHADETVVDPPVVVEMVALDPCNPKAGSGIEPSKCINLSIGSVVATVVELFFVVAVVISLGFLIYGGIKWITSGGDKNAVSSARSTLIAAIVGLVIVFLSYVILNLVLIFLTGSGIADVTFNPLIPH